MKYILQKEIFNRACTVLFVQSLCMHLEAYY